MSVSGGGGGVATVRDQQEYATAAVAVGWRPCLGSSQPATHPGGTSPPLLSFALPSGSYTVTRIICTVLCRAWSPVRCADLCRHCRGAAGQAEGGPQQSLPEGKTHTGNNGGTKGWRQYYSCRCGKLDPATPGLVASAAAAQAACLSLVVSASISSCVAADVHVSAL